MGWSLGAKVLEIFSLLWPELTTMIASHWIEAYSGTCPDNFFLVSTLSLSCLRSKERNGANLRRALTTCLCHHLCQLKRWKNLIFNSMVMLFSSLLADWMAAQEKEEGSFSENNRMVWIRKASKDHLVQPPDMCIHSSSASTLEHHKNASLCPISL